MIKVYYDESPAGAGKTERAINNIVKSSCRTIFVTERKESFPEIDERIRKSASIMGTSPFIAHIHGDMECLGRSVSKAVAEVPDRYAGIDHVIVIITHAALLTSDFSGFAGWQIVIDEVPAFLDFEEKTTHLDSAYFSRYYHLEHVSDDWCMVTATTSGVALSVADVRADDSHSHLDVFHARVLDASRPNSGRYVLCNLPDWAAMEERKVKWCWASTFSLRELAAFERIELLGNRFRSDIGSMLTRFFDGDEVEWEPLPPLPNLRQSVKRSVLIHYFSDRQAAKSFCGGDKGQSALREIGKYLATVLPTGSSIWSANDTAVHGQPTPKKVLGLPADASISPKQAGTNRFSKLSDAAIIYAAKPCPNLRGLLLALKIDPAAWTRTIEHEAILQFVTRTSVRDPANATAVNLYVFDREQAEYLRAYFEDLAHVEVVVSQIPLTVAIPPKSKGGRPPTIRSPQEQAKWLQ